MHEHEFQVYSIAVLSLKPKKSGTIMEASKVHDAAVMIIPATINLFTRVHSSESICVGTSSPRTMRLAPKTNTINAAIRISRMIYISAPVSLNSVGNR